MLDKKYPYPKENPIKKMDFACLFWLLKSKYKKQGNTKKDIIVKL